MIFVFQTSQLSGHHPKETIDAFKDDLIRLKANHHQFTWHNEGTEEEALHFSLNNNKNFIMENDNNGQFLYWMGFATGGKILCAQIIHTQLTLSEGPVAHFARNKDTVTASAIAHKKIETQSPITHPLVVGANDATTKLAFTDQINDLLQAKKIDVCPDYFVVYFLIRLNPLRKNF